MEMTSMRIFTVSLSTSALDYKSQLPVDCHAKIRKYITSQNLLATKKIGRYPAEIGDF